MGQASPDWLSRQRAAEQAMLERFAELDAVLIRVDGYVRNAEAAASALARMPDGNPAAREQEAKDLRQLVTIAAHHLANLDRIHLLEQPRSDRRANTPRREAAR